MKGSEKQIKWAEDIKATMFAQIAAMKKDREKFDAIDGRRDSTLYPYTHACIEAVEAELNELWSQDVMNDAHIIIENRDHLRHAVEKAAEEWMRTHK